MNLQTKIPLSSQKHHQIDYNAPLLLLGSCFSENIGAKFIDYRFQTLINPFGILFHPLAIEQLITRSINRTYYKEEDLIEHNGVYSCFDAHSRLNSTSKDRLLQHLNTALDTTYLSVQTVSHIVITLGTSWVYRHISSDKIVANCHKIPQKQFVKELLPIDTISETLEALVCLVKSVNPNVKFIFTVSPVRHLKDGFVENTRSKSHLLSAVHQVVAPRDGLYYFPAFELMLDELRDYRFYNNDMLHPSSLAIDYIWEAFKTVWLKAEALAITKKILALLKRKNHKPFQPHSEAHKLFLEKLYVDIQEFQAKHPQIVLFVD